MALYVCAYDMTSRCGSQKFLVFWSLKKVRSSTIPARHLKPRRAIYKQCRSFTTFKYQFSLSLYIMPQHVLHVRLELNTLYSRYNRSFLEPAT